MARQGTIRERATGAALLLALALMPLANLAHAQSTGSVNDYQLPAGKASSAPVTGPVDPEIPSPPPSAAPAPPRPAAPPSPAATITPRPATQPAAAASRPAPPVARPQAPASISPAQQTSPPAATEPPITGPSPVAAPASPTLTPPPPVTPGWPSWLWWATGALLALLLAGGFFVLRRSTRPRGATQFDEPLFETGVKEAPSAKPAPVPASAIPRPAYMPAPLELALEPQRMTAGLVNATLAYRLTLTNRGSVALGPISIACDIVSAHASLSASEQLFPDPQMVEPRHQFLSLFPGESIALSGELRLPLGEIRPIRSGNASLFVPLARFRIVALEEDQPPHVSTRVFVIGETPDLPGDRLKPFRLDQGPRTFSRIGQRDVTISA